MRGSYLKLGAALFGLALLAIALRFLLAAALPASMVAYMTLETGLPIIVVHDLTHDLQRRLPANILTEPAFSPDGSRLALTKLLQYGSEIVVYDLLRDRETSLTAFLAIAESPDGAHIAFSSNQAGAASIYLVQPDGAGLRRITSSDAGDREPNWSPDGRSLVFTSNRGGSWDLYTLELEAGYLRQLTMHRAPDNSPAWSPDGTRIAFASRRDGASGIYLLWLDTLQVEPLVVDTRYDSLPQWTPDGRAITFARSVDGSSRIMRVDVHTGALTRLNLGGLDADALTWCC